MSKTGVIVALVMAVALAVVAVVVLGPQRPGAGGAGAGAAGAAGAMLPFQPAQVVAIRVQTTDGASQTIERERRGGWVYVAEDGGRWPIQRTAIDNALRLLAVLRVEPDADDGHPMDGENTAENDWQTWPGFEITLTTGAVWRVACQTMVIGGHRVVRVEPPAGSDAEVVVARVEGEILAALIETGVGAWRVRRALPEVSPDTTRVRLETPAHTVQLVRRGNRWRLIEPVTVAADDAAVQMLLRRLAGVAVHRFVADDADDADRAGLGLDEPVSVAVLEREVMARTPGSGNVTRTIERMTERRRLVVGGGADVAASRMNALVTKAHVAPDGTVLEETSTVIEVTAKSLARVVSLPEAYISKRAAEVAAANVGAITVRTLAGDVRFDKTIDGWFRRGAGAGGAGGATTPGERAGDPAGGRAGEPTRVLIEGERRLAALLGFLSETDAKSVGIGSRVDAQEVCEIRLGSLGGQPLETITLSTTGSGEIIARKGEVYWVLAGNLDDVLAWLLEQAGGQGGG